jgi:hypothetical protein
MPRRIQRQRTAGWRKPKGAVYVGRPTKWGNPFPVADSHSVAVEKFSNWVHEQPYLIREIKENLAGRDLMCWCPVGVPCHADVLLAIANS